VAAVYEDDLPGQVSELVLSFTAVDHDGVTGSGDLVAQPVVTGELPDGLDRVQFHRTKRQRPASDGGGCRTRMSYASRPGPDRPQLVVWAECLFSIPDAPGRHGRGADRGSLAGPAVKARSAACPACLPVAVPRTKHCPPAGFSLVHRRGKYSTLAGSLAPPALAPLQGGGESVMAGGASSRRQRGATTKRSAARMCSSGDSRAALASAAGRGPTSHARLL